MGTNYYDKALREGLHVLLLHTEPAAVLRNWCQQTAKSCCQSISDEFSTLLTRAHPGQFSGDDARQVAALLKQRFQQPGSIGVFSLISDFAGQTLVQRECRPMVRYEQVLRWRHTVHPLGTLPFMCAFLAEQDLAAGAVRRDFCLNPVLQTDNRRLKAMLAQGMAENHFHLKGSARACLLSWVSLMNDMTKRTKQFRRLSASELGESIKGLDRPLYVLAVQAAAIRAFLFAGLTDTSSAKLKDTSSPNEVRLLSSLLEAEKEIDCTGRVGELQNRLNSLRGTGGKSYLPLRPDYAMGQMDCTPEEKPFVLLSGEYAFQYWVFRAIFQRNPRIEPYWDLFYAYLMIQIRFRGELIQSSSRVGFENFSQYDNRKGDFLKGRHPFEEAYTAGAAAAVLGDRRVCSLEARIVPKQEAGALERQIQQLDCQLRQWDNQETDYLQIEHRLYYVLHIPKRPDVPNRGGGDGLTRCRDAALRQETAAVAGALIRLREAGSPAASRIRGMDACANEADARPEVFAPAYRRLKDHQPPPLPALTSRIPMLNVTYHVGEDFPDLVDGLRAVWEAVTFLELGRSDRIGHGLALGIDPEHWYRSKQYRVYLTRQALLDNCAWMLYQLKGQGLLTPQLARELEEECALQYAAVYQSGLPAPEREVGFDVVNYVRSLDLRGDEPACYREYQNLEAYQSQLSLYLGKNPYCLREDAAGQSCHFTRRHNIWAIRLYHHYHYNPEVKRRGSEVVEHQVSQHYVQGALHLQRVIQAQIARLGVGIETNPSSNVLIGSFKRYDQHPLVTFHDRGLFDKPDNPNLFVSINTDDQGVFDTCLENEYALMARSLEQLTDAEGHSLVSGDRIYQWLDHIRRMGLEQSFSSGETDTRPFILGATRRLFQ